MKIYQAMAVAALATPAVQAAPVPSVHPMQHVSAPALPVVMGTVVAPVTTPPVVVTPPVVMGTVVAPPGTVAYPGGNPGGPIATPIGPGTVHGTIINPGAGGGLTGLGAGHDDGHGHDGAPSGHDH